MAVNIASSLENTFIKNHVAARRSAWVGKNASEDEVKNAIPYNTVNSILPVIQQDAKKDEPQNELKSSLKSYFIFSLGLSTIGLAYSKIKQGVSYLRTGIPTDPKSLTKLTDRFFTPNIIGFDMGSRVATQAVKEKVLPTLFKNPIKALQMTMGNVVSKEAAAKPISSLLKSSGFTSWIVMGLIFGVGDTYKAFKQGIIPGVKQLAKSTAAISVNAAGFVTGELIGSTIGAAVGTAICPLAGQIGAWAGGMAGGCIASYYADKHISSPLGLTPKPEVSNKAGADTQKKKLYV